MQKSVLPGHKMWPRVLLKSLLIMKLAVVIILLTGLQVNATATLGQKVSLKTYRTEIKKVLKQIESEGHFRFLYNSDLKDLKTKVDFSAVNLTIEQSLAGLFAGTNLTYKQLGGNLIAVLSSDVRENARIKITGKVTGENNEALSGASVLEKGTNNGTFADNNGN